MNCVHVESNGPPSITKQVLASIKKCMPMLPASEKVFNESTSYIMKVNIKKYNINLK